MLEEALVGIGGRGDGVGAKSSGCIVYPTPYLPSCYPSLTSFVVVVGGGGTSMLVVVFVSGLSAIGSTDLLSPCCHMLHWLHPGLSLKLHFGAVILS